MSCAAATVAVADGLMQLWWILFTSTATKKSEAKKH